MSMNFFQACVYVSICLMPTEVKSYHDPLELELQSFEHHKGGGKGSLQVQKMALVTEPPLWSPQSIA